MWVVLARVEAAEVLVRPAAVLSVRVRVVGMVECILFFFTTVRETAGGRFREPPAADPPDLDPHLEPRAVDGHRQTRMTVAR